MDAWHINTGNDFDGGIRTVAEAKADCLLKLRCGTCTARDCLQCVTMQRLHSVYSAFDPVGQMAVDQMAERMYQRKRWLYEHSAASDTPGKTALTILIGYLMFFAVGGIAFLYATFC